MGFDTKSFLNVSFKPRTRDVPVPALKQWFKNGDQPVWKIRSLSGAEIGRADETVGNEAITSKMFEAMLATNTKDIIDKVKELTGRSHDKPQSIAKRIYHLQYGSVDPECSLELAVKLCDNFPVVFLELTNNILELSGLGFDPGKSKPSGETKK